MTFEQLKIRLKYLGYQEGDYTLPDWWDTDLNKSPVSILELSGIIAKELGMSVKKLTKRKIKYFDGLYYELVTIDGVSWENYPDKDNLYQDLFLKIKKECQPYEILEVLPSDDVASGVPDEVTGDEPTTTTWYV